MLLLLLPAPTREAPLAAARGGDSAGTGDAPAASLLAAAPLDPIAAVFRAERATNAGAPEPAADEDEEEEKGTGSRSRVDPAAPAARRAAIVGSGEVGSSTPLVSVPESEVRIQK